MLVLAGEQVDVGWLPEGRLVGVGRRGDVGADGPATGILLHMSLNYISNSTQSNIFYVNLKKGHRIEE